MYRTVFQNFPEDMKPFNEQQWLESKTNSPWERAAIVVYNEYQLRTEKYSRRDQIISEEEPLLEDEKVQQLFEYYQMIFEMVMVDPIASEESWELTLPSIWLWDLIIEFIENYTVFD